MSRKREVRFVVGVAGGLRSSTWKCWTPGRGKSDIYLAPRSVGGSFKLSLHEGGAAHVGLTSEFKRELVDEARWTGGSRLMAEFSPQGIGGGCLLGFRVLVPAGAVTIDSAGEKLPEDLVWIPPPPSDQAKEIALVITPKGIDSLGGTAAAGLIGDFPLDSGQHLWIVQRTTAMPVIAQTRGAVSRFVPPPEFSEPLDCHRAIVVIDSDGHPAALMEFVLEDHRFREQERLSNEE